MCSTHAPHLPNTFVSTRRITLTPFVLKMQPVSLSPASLSCALRVAMSISKACHSLTWPQHNSFQSKLLAPRFWLAVKLETPYAISWQRCREVMRQIIKVCQSKKSSIRWANLYLRLGRAWLSIRSFASVKSGVSLPRRSKRRQKVVPLLPKALMMIGPLSNTKNPIQLFHTSGGRKRTEVSAHQIYWTSMRTSISFTALSRQANK